jgi:hypothetical protein
LATWIAIVADAPKPKQPQSPPGRARPDPRDPQTPEADDTAAEQRRDGVGIAVRQRVDEVGLGGDELGIATVAVPPGELRGFAQVLPVAAAEAADSTRLGEPHQPDPTALQPTRGEDLADDLMPGDERQTVGGQIPVQDLQVGPAHGRGLHTDEDLVGGGLGIRAVTDDEGVDGGHGRGVHASQCALRVSLRYPRESWVPA